MRWFPPIAILFLTPALVFAGSPETYQNPVIPGVLADPGILKHDGVYYLYPTALGDGYNVYTSKDLVHWTEGPRVFTAGRPRVWAPDVYFHPEDGRFYLYFSANFSVGVAVADSPLGPFKEVTDLVSPAIDAQLFRDDDGRLYLYYVRTVPPFVIWVMPMKNPITPAGAPTELIRPDVPWERGMTEGPWVLKHDGKYVMLYSGWGADDPRYAIGMATADSPLGPFRKFPGNPILKGGGGVFGPGHGGVVEDGAGNLWSVYHQKADARIDFNRFIAIDRLFWEKDGSLRGEATRGRPQPTPVPLPESRVGR